MSPPPRRVLADAGGAVYVEFLLVFIPVFTLFLAVLQLGLVYAAKLVSQHAATTATRAATVVIDDDPDRYDRTPRRRVDPAGSAASPSPVAAFLAGAGLGTGSTDGGDARFRDIRAAALIPLIAVSPSLGQLGDRASVGGAIGQGAARASNAHAYGQAALAVTFPRTPGGDDFRIEFAADEPITVRVTYLVHCAIPLVSQLMCQSPAGLGRLLLAEERRQLDLGFLAGQANARFLVVRSEATLPGQTAGYRFRSEVE